MNWPMSQHSQPADDELRRLAEPLLGRAAAYAFSLLGNREDAEDAIQDALLKAYRGLARHDRSQGFKAWWFAIVRNCCRDLHRSRSRRAPSVAVDAADSPAGDQSAWEEAERRADRERKAREKAEQDAFLSGLLGGETIGACGDMEPEASLDAWMPKTTASSSGSGAKLTGCLIQALLIDRDNAFLSPGSR